MKQDYVELQMDILVFDQVDVITTSEWEGPPSSDF